MQGMMSIVVLSYIFCLHSELARESPLAEKLKALGGYALFLQFIRGLIVAIYKFGRKLFGVPTTRIRWEFIVVCPNRLAILLAGCLMECVLIATD